MAASCVVVGVDFSAPSRRALEVATSVSARAGMRLELVHVLNTWPLSGSAVIPGIETESFRELPQIDQWIRDQTDATFAQLEEWAADARGRGVDVQTRVVDGAASRMLPEVARTSRAAMVVVGRRGTASLAHVLLGSVSERVVHQAACPVLVVPERSPAALCPEHWMVGVDFSAASRDAYREALRLAEKLHSKQGLVLAHVRPGEHDFDLENWSELAYRDPYPYDLEALKRWAAQHHDGDAQFTCRILEGRAEQQLVSAAAKEACDWLVLGLQGRSALAALLIGSTTDRILKLADRPVLVVPSSSGSPGEFSG